MFLDDRRINFRPGKKNFLVPISGDPFLKKKRLSRNQKQLKKSFSRWLNFFSTMNIKEVMAHWKICVLRANDDPRWQTIHSFWVRIFSFQIQFIRSPEIVYSILILRENWIVDYRIEKMLFEYSYYGQNLCFFSKKKRNAYLPTQIFNLKKWEPRIFLSWPYRWVLKRRSLHIPILKCFFLYHIRSEQYFFSLWQRQ